MNAYGIYIVILTFALVLIFINCLMTRDLWSWVPPLKKRIGLTLAVWLLPILGLWLANKYGFLGWFKKRKAGESSAIATGLMGMDSFFNPGMQHRMEIVEKRKSEVLRKNKRGQKKESDD